MTTHRRRQIVCVLGAFAVSTGLAQEIVPSNAIRASSVTNHLPAVGVFPGPNWDVRYDAHNSDVGIGMRLNLPIGPLRFDYAGGKKPSVRFFDAGTPVRTKLETAQGRLGIESAERENLRLMNDYRSRAASPAAPHVPPQFHPSAVEEILNRR